jgi:hypothetical protein
MNTDKKGWEVSNPSISASLRLWFGNLPIPGLIVLGAGIVFWGFQAPPARVGRWS